MMTRIDRRVFLATSGAAAVGVAGHKSFGASPVQRANGVVVGYRGANEAGAEMLAAGGNVIDAVVAGALVAGVTAIHYCGIGGYGGHLIVSTREGKLAAIDFNSTAPAAARPDMFVVDEQGNVKNKSNMQGWLATGVPGILAGLQLALDRFGTMKFTRVVQPAIRIARDGFPSPVDFQTWFAPAKPQSTPDPNSVKLFMPNGKILRKGDQFHNPQLADMLQELAESGSVEPFYRGRIARHIAEQFKKNGGIVTEKDFNDYHAIEQTPYQLNYRNRTIATAPLTAGGLTVLQVLAALEELAWHALPESPTKFQTWIEALRIAWGDRLQFFGDPKFIASPVERLLSKTYAKETAQRVSQAVAEKRPVAVPADGRTANGTVNLSACDALGNMAALTLTHGDGFGARVTVDGLGLLLGHGMSRFDPVPGKLNSIAPGKRPLDNMCPSVVLEGGQPTIVLGGIGGRRIPNGILQTLLQLLANDRGLNDAVQAPRIHTEGGLDLYVEKGIAKANVDYMRKIGYTIKPQRLAFVGAVQYEKEKNGQPLIRAAVDNQPEIVVQTNTREKEIP